MRTDITTLRELRVHYSTPTDTTGAHVSITAQILQAADAAPALQALLGAEVVEVFGILCLSTKCRVIAYHEVSRGTLDATLVHPREVFKAALLANAASVMLAHNHPSGDPSPSPDDCALTRRLVAAGHLIGIPVTDHIIIGAGRWVSLRASGLLQLF
jgi:DNA repair protein RadC